MARDALVPAISRAAWALARYRRQAPARCFGRRLEPEGRRTASCMRAATRLRSGLLLGLGTRIGRPTATEPPFLGLSCRSGLGPLVVTRGASRPTQAGPSVRLHGGRVVRMAGAGPFRELPALFERGWHAATARGSRGATATAGAAGLDLTASPRPRANRSNSGQRPRRMRAPNGLGGHGRLVAGPSFTRYARWAGATRELLDPRGLSVVSRPAAHSLPTAVAGVDCGDHRRGRQRAGFALTTAGWLARDASAY
jgi:hypothetical protein